MRSTRTALTGIFCSVAASVALAVGSAGQASASEPPAATAVLTGLQDEVPWTVPNPEVPWTGPIGTVITGLGEIAAIVLDGVEAHSV
ncbi:hypothetical protein [Streptomyces sp. NPDC059072]|uniref:hypothetical protein n=1 Tax=unclassified Streptomyces TaxID=2593676 RepID=UPI0036C4988C